MANPVQEYQTARSMPIPALVAVLNGQSDMVSLGVAHAALKEKMEAEVAKKGANAMQMAQSPKVVQKDMQMAQGLAGTPADLNVPMGGIVGSEGQMSQTAAGGGSVVAFQAGGSPPPTFGGMMQQRAASAPGFMGRVRQGLGALDRFATGRGGLLGPQLALTPTATNVGEQEYLDLMRKLVEMGYPPDMIAAMSNEQRIAAAQGKLPMGQADTGGVPTQTLASIEAAQAKPEAAPPAGGGVADIAAAQARVEQPTSFTAVTDQAKELAKQYEIKPSGTTKDFAGFSKEYVDTLKEAGYDFDLVKNNIRELAKEKEALKGEKKEAQNLRLIEAGLGILGGESPYAFVNIGKGATPALQGLAKDLKDIKKARRELDKETLQLNLLQNQMAEGKVKYAQGRLDKQEERQARAAEKNAEIQFRIADRMSSNSIQRYVADRQLDAASANLQATQADRAAKRDLDMKEAALKQAAEEVKMMPAEQQEAEKRKRAAKYYQMLKDKDFGAAPSGNVLRFDAQGNLIQ